MRWSKDAGSTTIGILLSILMIALLTIELDYAKFFVWTWRRRHDWTFGGMIACLRLSCCQIGSQGFYLIFDRQCYYWGSIEGQGGESWSMRAQLCNQLRVQDRVCSNLVRPNASDVEIPGRRGWNGSFQRLADLITLNKTIWLAGGRGPK